MNWRLGAMALMVAGPVLTFPFSRAYYVFYVLILATALLRCGLPALWRQAPVLRMAVYGLLLPMLLSILALTLVYGHGEKDWWSRLGIMTLAALLGLATMAQARQAQAQGPWLAWLLVAAVGSWVLDGLWQLATGYSLSGQAMIGRLTAYFSHPYKFGFFISFLSFLPVFYLYQRRGYRASWLAVVVLLLSGLVVFSAGSRFGMVSWLLGVGVLALLAIRHWSRWQRWSVILGLPLLLLALLSGLYAVNDAFAQRAQASMLVLQKHDYDTINQASSSRLDIWYPAVSLLQDHWVLGVGPGKISEVIKPYLGDDNIYKKQDIKIFHAHQVVLGVWLGAGLAGVLGFLAFFFWVCRWLWRERAQAGLGWACVMIWVLAWFPLGTHLDFYASEMMLWSFYMLGLGLGLHEAETAAPQSASPQCGAEA